MLSIYGKPTRYCDGIARRGFLRIGGFTMGSVVPASLSGLMRAQAASPGRSALDRKAVINIFLGGGPPHQDMWEIKTDAPSEIRGEFQPISTAVPGIQIGECFPKLAAIMDRLVVVRSVVGCDGAHDAFQCQTGWRRRDLDSIGGRPSMGSVVSRLRGPVDPGIPATVALAARTSHVPWSEPGSPGFLGSAHQPFQPNGNGMDDLTLNGITLERLADRRTLLTSLDQLKRNADVTGQLSGADAFTEAAFGVLTSSKLAEALDVSKEPEEIQARYGTGKPYQYQYDGAPTCNDHLLLARRLVEAGVRSVTLSYGRWDSHGANFDLVRDHGGKLDQALS
ncbi:MAG: DUF1501 domain-containing protein, partial [Planctomycetaceae bacterium]